MLKEVDSNNVIALYNYFRDIERYIPYYFPIDYDTWYKCMFDDYLDGKRLFKDIKTFLYYENDLLKGFIQYGISNFVFTDNGTDYSNNYAIIRNLHYSKNSKNPKELVEKALEYFGNKFNEISAFFHIFGMSCYARHGKLHNSAFYIEDLLYKYSFTRGHENVYFSKSNSPEDDYNDPKITFQIEQNGENKEKITFFQDDDQIGYSELAFLHKNISYMYIIEITEKIRNQNYGTRCMNIIFRLLKERKIVQLDLDTIDSNYIAQKFYTKLGFEFKGITRSYSLDKVRTHFT